MHCFARTHPRKPDAATSRVQPVDTHSERRSLAAQPRFAPGGRGLLCRTPRGEVGSLSVSETSSAVNHDFPFAKELFEAADRLRGSVESAEYKHLVLGLLFLKYISDSFERRRQWLFDATLDTTNTEYYTEEADERLAILEDRDEYISENVFWVPEGSRFSELLKAAAQPDIGQRIDRALEEIERDNPEQLRGVLPRIYARAPIPASKLGALVSTIAKIGFGEDAEHARDLLGRTYEYFIKSFARAEGHRGGEFYTPASVTRLLVEMLEPYEGRVLDPACGSGGLFIQSAEFVKAHGGRSRQISILGQENNQATWRICRMNLAIHGISGDVRLGDSLLDDNFGGVRADYVMANPPFNMKKWGAGQVAKDARWEYGEPPDRSANYAWIQHFIHHLTPNGRAGFVMANGSLTSNTSGEGTIREQLIKADLVDCIVALPGQLFFTTGIPVCLWFIDRDKTPIAGRDRRGETLFIDARQMGTKISRTQIELTDHELARIVRKYHGWRGQAETDEYLDEPGFCKASTAIEIEATGFALSPGRYVGTPAEEENEGAFEERMADLAERLRNDFAESERLTAEVKKALGAVGYEF
jgi:type I restriction enzyme M protein